MLSDIPKWCKVNEVLFILNYAYFVTKPCMHNAVHTVTYVCLHVFGQ